jgi:hypothetical protein
LEVDRLLREIYIQHRGQMELIVFSDHGNSHVQNWRIDLDGFLAQQGFRVEPAIRSESSVVIPAFGLVGRCQSTPSHRTHRNWLVCSRVMKPSISPSIWKGRPFRFAHPAGRR